MMDQTPHMTERQLYEAAYEMDRSGGGFASAVANAFFRADGYNRKRLLFAFGDLFVQFAPTPDTTEGESK
jgi:hypothetical protein